MLHTYVQRFDVTENLKILAKFLASKRSWPWQPAAQLPSDQAAGTCREAACMRCVLQHPPVNSFLSPGFAVRAWGAYSVFLPVHGNGTCRSGAERSGAWPFHFLCDFVLILFLTSLIDLKVVVMNFLYIQCHLIYVSSTSAAGRCTLLLVGADYCCGHAYQLRSVKSEARLCLHWVPRSLQGPGSRALEFEYTSCFSFKWVNLLKLR
jgi:hypothetical protein